MGLRPHRLYEGFMEHTYVRFISDLLFKSPLVLSLSKDTSGKKPLLIYGISSVLFVSVLSFGSVIAEVATPVSPEAAAVPETTLPAAPKPVPSADRVMVDEVLIEIYGNTPGSGGVILKSDLERPSIEGQPRTLRSMLLERLKELDAKSIGVDLGADAEKTLADAQRASGMSRAALVRAFDEMGYTQEEGTEELRRRQMIAQVLDARVRSDKSLVIQKSAVEEYHRAHPEVIEATYKLATVCLPPETPDKKVFTPEELAALKWEEPFVVSESMLADDRRSIITAKVGTLVARERVAEGLELTKLVAKTERYEKSFEERYDELSEQIYKERYMQVLADYEKSLLEKATVRFTYPEDQKRVFEAEKDEQ